MDAAKLQLLAMPKVYVETRRKAVALKILIRKISEFRKMPEKARFQRLTTMDRNGKAYDAAALAVDMMTTANP